jgi:hypothetical protein
MASEGTETFAFQGARRAASRRGVLGADATAAVLRFAFRAACLRARAARLHARAAN